MYTISSPSGTIRNDGVIVPNDDSTPEYQAYIEFLRLGGAPVQIADQVDPPRPPHAVCMPWQLRKALNARAQRQMVDDYVATLDQDARDGWEYVTQWESDHPLLLSAAAGLGWTDADVHELISYASTL